MPRSTLAALALMLTLLAFGDWYASPTTGRGEAPGGAEHAEHGQNGVAIGTAPQGEPGTASRERHTPHERGVDLPTLMFVIGVIGLVIVAWQSYETRRSAEASERSARASERAVTDLETPWLTAEVTEHSVSKFFDVPEPDSPIKRRPVMAKLKISNQGRSPAWVLYSSVNFRLKELPLDEEPPYWSMERAEYSLVQNGALEKPFGTQLNGFDRKAMIEGRACLVLFGVVGYRDILGREDEMRYSFIWQFEVPLPMLSFSPGPPKWTRPRMRPGDRKAEADNEQGGKDTP